MPATPWCYDSIPTAALQAAAAADRGVPAWPRVRLRPYKALSLHCLIRVLLQVGAHPAPRVRACMHWAGALGTVAVTRAGLPITVLAGL
jgi:hypothetical protein